MPVITRPIILRTAQTDASSNASATMDPARAVRLLQQHARTVQLLGVDFVPAYRTSTDLAPPMAPVDDVPTAPHSGGAGVPPRVEVKPVGPVGVVGGQRERASGALPGLEAAVVAPAPAGVATLADWSPPARGAGEEERSYRVRALEALFARYRADAPHAAFNTTFKNLVFHDGDVQASLCFVGEAPGADEDASGVPFVGRAGQLLDKMIAGMGLARQAVYICNVVKARPPENATPTPAEMDAALPYLLAQLDIVRPQALVALGLVAARALLRTQSPMGRLRGSWAQLVLPSGHEVPVMPTYHPAYVLRNPTQETKAAVWSDLQLVMARLGLARPGKPKAGE